MMAFVRRILRSILYSCITGVIFLVGCEVEVADDDDSSLTDDDDSAGDDDDSSAGDDDDSAGDDDDSAK